MRRIVLGLVVLTVFGCQTTPLDYPTLEERIGEGTDVSTVQLRDAFVQQATYTEDLDRLTELEAQALQLVDDEPLKLGSLGTAILDIYYGSLAGHFVMQRFYDHVENTETADFHGEWVEKIKVGMRVDNDPSDPDAPFPAMTAIEPIAYARSENLVPVGSIYRTNKTVPFALLIQARPKQGNLQSLYFDLTTVFNAAGAKRTNKEEEFTPFELMAQLARQNDTAAQAAIGAYLASHNRLDDASQWLQASSRSGNVLANNLLARVYWEQAETSKDQGNREQAMEQVMENYLHAIALGSADAAYALGVLYLNNHFGPDNQESGIPLLQQAAAADHAGSTLYLAHLYYSGDKLEQNHDTAEELYRDAAQLSNPPAQRAYARFLLDRDQASREPHGEVMGWLEALAAKQDAEAMILLGNMAARGVGMQQSNRTAIRWYEKAVAIANNDSNIINEIAWTLSVTDLPGMVRGKYAVEIMTVMMTEKTEAATRPEYLDTWAAAYAANSDFEKAVEVQTKALELAREANNEAVVKELESHLESFKAGRSLVEPVP